MGRAWNVSIYLGFLLVVFAFLSYFVVFSQFPLTRDFPWANLLLFLGGIVLLGRGIRRAWREPTRCRGRFAAPVLGVLGALLVGFFLFYTFVVSAQLPPSKQAPRVGERAPDFTLPDQDGQPVRLSELRGQPVLLVFYRGHW